MGEFTVAQVETIANSTLDFYLDKRKVQAQSLQDKPLLQALRAAEKTFPGGKENLTGAAKFDYSTTIQGFVNDDEVGYSNPANTKRFGNQNPVGRTLTLVIDRPGIVEIEEHLPVAFVSGAAGLVHDPGPLGGAPRAVGGPSLPGGLFCPGGANVPRRRRSPAPPP